MPNTLGGRGEVAVTASCRPDSKSVIYSEAFDQLVIRTSWSFCTSPCCITLLLIIISCQVLGILSGLLHRSDFSLVSIND